MSEEIAIKRTDVPRTRSSLANNFRTLGLKEGMTVIVHTSMSSLGWVCGGSIAVIQALQDVVTSKGTLVMPTHSANVSDPMKWENPPVPKSWWSTIREEMPAFDSELTPTFLMGCIAEAFRTFPGVKRSYHPTHSFAAWGKHRDTIINEHSLNNGLGEKSPLAKVYKLNGYVLLLGVGYDNNTSMHLGEHRSKCLDTITNASPILEKGRRVWRNYEELDYNDEIFPKIGEAFEAANRVNIGMVGSAESRLMSQPAIVDFTAEYICRYSKGYSGLT